MKHMKQRREHNDVDVSKWTFNRRESHKAKCADCGKDCTVPFEPKEGRPVYCRECLPKHKRF